jgi:hypothetical protein
MLELTVLYFLERLLQTFDSLIVGVSVSGSFLVLVLHRLELLPEFCIFFRKVVTQ